MGFDGINGWILWNPNRQSKTIWFLSSVDRQEVWCECFQTVFEYSNYHQVNIIVGQIVLHGLKV